MKFRLALLPHKIIPLDPKGNLDVVEQTLSELDRPVDLVLLPELFTTAYNSATEKMKAVAETKEGLTMERVKQWAAKYNCGFAGSYCATDGEGNYFNRGFIVEPSGEATFYDKRHLFIPSREAELFTAGERPAPVVRFRGWNIKLVICFDLRFPEWCRNEEGEYDLLLVPANWGGARAYAFEHLLIARGIENQAYVAGLNRTGEDEYGDYTEGMSGIFDYKGRRIGEGQRVIYAELDRDKMNSFRSRFPVLHL